MLGNKVTPKLANSTHGGGLTLYRLKYYLLNLKIKEIPHIKNVTYY